MSTMVMAKLRAENKLLKDLLETQYRETDKARAESEKADDEAMELKVELAKLHLLGARNQLAERRLSRQAPHSSREGGR